MKLPLLVCAFAATLSVGLTAQSPKLRPAAEPVAGFVSLFEDAGTLWALGADYRARFLADGVEFTPLLGRLEPETRNLRLRLLATGRAHGQAALEPVTAPGRRTWHDLGVEVAHAGVREVYEVRSEGLKQNFVFTEKPAGGGDLVVRVGIETNMTVGTSDATGIRFEGSHGGAAIGKVIGIDATGRTVEGTLALAGDELEMRLPAAFVDAATAPITVDPLIAPTTTVNSGSEYYPDIAYDGLSDFWMVVWHRYVASNDSDIRAQALWPDGTLYNSGVGVRTSSEVSQKPRIATNRYQGTMVVVWEEAIGSGQRDIIARTVTLANQLGTVHTVTSLTDDQYDVDIGGNLATTGAAKSRVVVGYTSYDANDPEGSQVWAASLDVNGSNGTLTTHAQYAIGFAWDAQRISIADATPDRQAWMTVWDTYHIDWTTTPATAWVTVGTRDLYCNLLDSDLQSLSGGITLVADGYSIVAGSLFWYSVNGGKCLQASVAGDGDRWFVAYKLDQASSGFPHSIEGAALEYAAGAVSVRYAFRTIASGNVDQKGPAVAWMPDSVLVAHVVESAPGVVDPWLWTGDFDCNQCGSAVQVASTGNCWQTRIASRAGGSSAYAQDEAIVTYFDNALVTESIFAARFRSDDGLFENIGGGCGSGASVEHFTQCAVVGNANHVIRLLDAPADTAALLLLGFEAFSSQCGSCDLKINPFEAFPFALATDGNGEAVVPLPIPQNPGLLGLTFYQQWVIDNASAPGCAVLASDFTDALRVTIQ